MDLLLEVEQSIQYRPMSTKHANHAGWLLETYLAQCSGSSPAQLSFYNTNDAPLLAHPRSTLAAVAGLLLHLPLSLALSYRKTQRGPLPCVVPKVKPLVLL